jgi:uncharacterized protein DUF1905
MAPMAMRHFEAVLQSDEGRSTFIELPFDARAAFGRTRQPVRATVNGFGCMHPAADLAPAGADVDE